MASDRKGTITVIVGTKEHLVDPGTIPLFATMVASRSPGSENAPFIHDDIPFFEAINYSIQNGLRNLFRRMPHQLEEYRTLCQTLDYLGIDVRQELNLRDTTKLLKVESDHYDSDEGRVIQSSKTGARDAAFRFVYLLIKCGSSSPPLSTQELTIAYNAVSYIVSHRRIFGYRIRKMVREAFEAATPLTYKQRLALDKWPVTEPTYSGWQDDDETTTDGDDDDRFNGDFDWDSD